jgi:hypothetical protein
MGFSIAYRSVGARLGNQVNISHKSSEADIKNSGHFLRKRVTAAVLGD